MDNTTMLLKVFPDADRRFDGVPLPMFTVDISKSGAFVSVSVGSFHGNETALFRVLSALRLPWMRDIAEIGSTEARYRFVDPADLFNAVASFAMKGTFG